MFSFFAAGSWLLPGIWAWSPGAFLFFSFFSPPLADGCCPASGRGRLRGGRQGVRGAGPSTPPTTPILPCPCGGGRLCRMTCPLLSARRGGPSARIFPRCARAICAPAAALPLCGDRLRAPARWAERIFPACTYSDGKHLLRHGERPMPREKEGKGKQTHTLPARHQLYMPASLFGTAHGINKGKPPSPRQEKAVPQLTENRHHRFASVSAAWRGGDRRPAGAEAPTPPERSSRAKRGTAGGRCPMPRGREEAGGLPAQIDRPSRMAAPTRGWGS